MQHACAGANAGRLGAGQMRRSGREMAVMEPQLPRTSLFDVKGQAIA
jgi:hypothetical protein